MLISSSHSSSDFMGFRGLSGAIEIEPIKGNFETKELQISLASITLMVFTMSNNTKQCHRVHSTDKWYFLFL